MKTCVADDCQSDGEMPKGFCRWHWALHRAEPPDYRSGRERNRLTRPWNWLTHVAASAGLDREETHRFLQWLESTAVYEDPPDGQGFGRYDRCILLCWLAFPGERSEFEDRNPRFRRGIVDRPDGLREFVVQHREQWDNDDTEYAQTMYWRQVEAEREVRRKELYHPKGPARVGNPCAVCGEPIGDLYSELYEDHAERLLRERVCSWDCHERLARRRSQMERRAREKEAFVEAVVAERVFERDGWTCMLCGEPLDRDARWDPHDPPHGYPTIDHVVPLAVGGEHSYSNVQAAHHRCNMMKGAGR